LASQILLYSFLGSVPSMISFVQTSLCAVNYPRKLVVYCALVVCNQVVAYSAPANKYHTDNQRKKQQENQRRTNGV